MGRASWGELRRQPFPGLSARGRAHQMWKKPLPGRDSLALLRLSLARGELLTVLRRRLVEAQALQDLQAKPQATSADSEGEHDEAKRQQDERDLRNPEPDL